MARSYRHIQQYEKEILDLKGQGLTHKEIGERLVFTRKQIKEFFYRQREKERRLEVCRSFEASRSGYYGFIKRMDKPAKEKLRSYSSVTSSDSGLCSS